MNDLEKTLGFPRRNTTAFLRRNTIVSTTAACVLAVGCTLDGASAPRSAEDAVEVVAVEDPADGSVPLPLVTRITPSAPPTAVQIAETAAGLRRPLTVVRAHQGDETVLVLAGRDRERDLWFLEASFDHEIEIEGCPGESCEWPATLIPDTPLVEEPPLRGAALDSVAYLRTLLTYEGSLDVDAPDDEEDASWLEQLPATAYSDPINTDLAAFLEPLRRYHPRGSCSMDTRPQTAAMMRAVAAAQAGHTGWAVEGWVGAVGYWSSSRSAWSSYGESHPSEHFTILDMVNVDRRRVVIGALLQLPELPPVLYPRDARRVVEDGGPQLASEIRRMIADPSLDPYNRARLFATVGIFPFARDPQFAQLPPLTQAVLERWSR